jgi:hypothetical protein
MSNREHDHELIRNVPIFAPGVTLLAGAQWHYHPSLMENTDGLQTLVWHIDTRDLLRLRAFN